MSINPAAKKNALEPKPSPKPREPSPWFVQEVISVVVPVFNVEEYLPACIESILAQEYKSLEIILVDDGSTDNSSQICDDYKLKNENIVVIHKCNGGLSDARNSGIRAAKGEYITFVDGDDIIHPMCLRLLYNALKTTQTTLSICPLRSFSDKTETKFLNRKLDDMYLRDTTDILTKELALKEMLYEGRFDVSACGKLYKTSMFSDVEFPKGKIFEDLATTYQLIWKAENIALIPYKLYGYRQRIGSITRVPFHGKMKDALETCEGFCSFAKKNCPDCDKAIAYRRSKIATILLERIASSSNRAMYNSTAKELQSLIRFNLGVVLKYEKVSILQKVKFVSGAYSILLLKLVCKLYEILFYFYERLG